MTHRHGASSCFLEMVPEDGRGWKLWSDWVDSGV